ncbi:MAG: hypothetical protein RLZZ305_1216 [Actinomycetota bacterium]
MSQQRPRGSRPTMAMPNTGTMGAVVAVIALILGFLILRDVRNDGGATVSPGGTTVDTVPAGGNGDPAATTTVPPFNRGAFKIQVANASSIAGSAGDMTTKLQDQNFVVQPPLNVAPNTPKREKTGVFYLAGCESGAADVSAVLGGNVETGAMPSPIPLETGSLGEACVLVLLGTDLSMKPLQGVVGAPNGLVATTTTVAG